MTASTKEFWEKAYQNNIGKLIGTCYRYTRNYQLSEDLAHDAFLKAINKFGTFEEKGKFEAWLRRIVVNHTLQYLRDIKKDPELYDLISNIEFMDPIEEDTHPVKSLQFTEAELIHTIEQLPEHHRLVFNLYVVEEFTHAQIGQELGISEGTSKSHLARARKKLKQLLTQKAAETRNEKEYKKSFVLLAGGNADEKIDQLFRKCFEDFSMPPQHPLSPDSIPAGSQPEFNSTSFLKSNVNILVISAVVTITLIVVLIVNQTKKPEQKIQVLQQPSSDTAKKNPADSESQTATISRDSVILKRNLKQKHMKPLDSLALMLVLSSGQLNEITTKDSIKHEIEKYSLADAKLPADSSIKKSSLNFVNPAEAIQKETGTFSASELYWSAENKEVYFKGQVRVNFKDQHFQGKGSFTFLGKIHLLFVDGQEMIPGQQLKLTRDDYELIILGSKEAIEKYGDKGLNGAAEISRVK